MDIDRFLSEEVTRQGHVGEDHTQRCSYMKAAWEYAQELSQDSRLPTVSDCLWVAALVEPQNIKGLRNHNVQIRGVPIGSEKTRAAKDLQMLFDRLPYVKWNARRKTTSEDYPDETLDSWYIAFENVHPFADGNGRTGKILYNWIHGTLDDPVLVDDYFGYGVP